MKKIFLIWMLCVVLTPNLFSQQPGENRITLLKQVLPSLQGIAKIDALNAICNEYYDLGFFNEGDLRVDSIYYYATSANNEASKKKYNKGRSEALLMLGFVEKCRFKSQAAEKYINEALSLNNEDPNFLGKAFGFLGSIYYEGFKKPQPAADYFKKSIACFKRARNVKEEGLSMTRLCMLYSSESMFNEGIDYCTRAMTIAKQANASRTDGWTDFQFIQSTRNIIELYKKAGGISDAIEFQRLMNDYIRKRKLNINTKLDMGVLHALAGNFDSSIYLLKNFVASNPSVMWGKFQLGRTYQMKKELDKAEPLFRQCIDTFSKRNKGATTVTLSVYMGKLYLEKKDYENALFYARETFKSKQINTDPSFLLDKYDFLANAYSLNGIADSALIYLKKYTSLWESQMSFESVIKLNNYKRRAEDEKKAAELLMLAKDNELNLQKLKQQELIQAQKESHIELLGKDNKIKQEELTNAVLLRKEKEAKLVISDQQNKIKTQQLMNKDFVRNLLLLGLVVVLLTALFIFRTLILKRKNEKLTREHLENEMKMQKLENQARHAEFQQLATELEMKALHAQMNPHFIFNCLSSINWLILENNTNAASDYLTRFSRMIRMVLINSQKPLITLEDELKMLQLYLDMERLRFENIFDYKIDVAEDVSTENFNVPPLLLQPFCENSIWHGLMHKEGMKVLRVDIFRDENILTCCITDNGIGRRKAAEINQTAKKHHSRGLQISADRLALLNKERDFHTFYDIEDLADENGNAAGTRVLVRIKYKHLVNELTNLEK